tara:strand:- start:14761 stop:15309 length:549 start_codon:yes stop_codon:yes gene_type:complete
MNNNLANVLLEIKERSILNKNIIKINDWDKFLLFDKPFFFINIIRDVYEVITSKYGDELTEEDFLEILETDDVELSKEIFNYITNNYQTVMYFDNFYLFCSKASRKQIIDLIIESGLIQIMLNRLKNGESDYLNSDISCEKDSTIDNRVIINVKKEDDSTKKGVCKWIMSIIRYIMSFIYKK